MKDKYCHSSNGERYNGMFDTLEECLEDAKDSYHCDDGCYIGTCNPVEIRWNSNEEKIIQSIYDNADDSVEDGAEFITITVEQEIDLSKRIDETVAQWIKDNNIKLDAYTVPDGHWVEFGKE